MAIRARAIRAQAFDSRKALEALLYLTEKAPQPSFHSVSKLFYFADKLHLQRYGRLISGDSYIAMKHGPVPSAIYDMMKAPTGRVSLPNSDEIVGSLEVRNKWYLVALREPSLDLLSASEVECLQESVDSFGSLTFGQLTAKSHDAAWDSADQNNRISLDAIVSTLPNADELMDYLASA